MRGVVKHLLEVGLTAVLEDDERLQSEKQEARMDGKMRLGGLGQFSGRELGNMIVRVDKQFAALENLAAMRKLRSSSFTAAGMILGWCADYITMNDVALEAMEAVARKNCFNWDLSKEQAKRGHELVRRACVISRDEEDLGKLLDELIGPSNGDEE